MFFAITGTVWMEPAQAGWEDLPSELLHAVAELCQNPVVLLGVCRAWKVGLEGCVTSLKVKPAMPVKHNRSLALRFHSLTALDLQGCEDIYVALLIPLKALKLSSLSLSLARHEITPNLATTLGGLGLEKILLTSRPTSYEAIQDAHLQLLRGLPISLMHLCMNVSDVGVTALHGMPMVDLMLRGTFTNGGLGIGLRGMSLTYLDLAWCV